MPLTNDKSTTPALPGNGSVTTFDFDFVVWDESQVEVHYKNAAGIIVKLTANYSVILNPNQNTNPGGTVTYPIAGEALPNTESIVIQRNMPFVQMVDLEAGKTFNAEVIEEMFNTATAERQQLKEEVGRCAQAPPGGTGEAYLENCEAARAAAQAAQSASETARSGSETARDAAQGYRDAAQGFRNQAEVFKDQAAASVAPWTINGNDIEYAAGKVRASEFDGIAAKARYA